MENNALETLLTLNTNIPPSKDIPIEDDDNFDYFHSQVARGEFFAHTYEPYVSAADYDSEIIRIKSIAGNKYGKIR